MCCGGGGSGPRAGGDRWVDTKRRASGKTDGWGREEERWGGSGRRRPNEIGMGLELGRGEQRGEKKGEAALGDKGDKA